MGNFIKNYFGDILIKTNNFGEFSGKNNFVDNSREQIITMKFNEWNKVDGDITLLAFNNLIIY